MTPRERLLAAFDGTPADRLPDLEFGAWDQTYPRWHAEGMPAKHTQCDQGIIDYFHTDEEEWGPSPWINIGLEPGFTEEILEVKGDHLLKRDGDGATVEMLKPELGATIPKYVRYAIQTREDWERIKGTMLKIGDPKRFPKDLDAQIAASRTSTTPVILWCGSLYGWIRNWVGVERLSELFYEEPEWVEEMMEHLTLLLLDSFKPLAGKARIDLGNWWEDMCFKNGPLISPAMFRKFMVPRYRRVADFLKNECGCRHHMVDSDGRINELAPFWVEGGIDVMFPLEAPHTDGFAIKKDLGARVAMRGYYDKRALIAGPKAIDAEFARLMPLIKARHLVPGVDHRVPPDVSFENYRYYRREKCRILGKPYREG